MKSIAVTKPDMGVLSRERLLLSPFGALSQAFGEELLARAQQSEGVWPYVPLELLEEGEEPQPPAAPVKPVLHIDLHLVLEALRREGLTTPQQRATERIVERILQLQTRSVPPGKQAGPAHSPAPSLSVFGTIRQEFHPQLIQNIRISAPASQPKAMGELARKARDFSHRLQALREEGASPAREVRLAQGTIAPVSPAQAPPTGPASGGTAHLSPLPQQALTLLEEQEGQAAPFQEQNTRLLRQMDQLQTLLEAGERKDTKSGSAPARPGQAADHSPRSPSLSAGGKETETHPRKGAPDPTSRPQEVTHGHFSAVHAQSSPLPVSGERTVSPSSPRELRQQDSESFPGLARDIRVNGGDSPQGTISPLGPAPQTMGQTAGIPMTPSQITETNAPVILGQNPLPVALTLHTEEMEGAGKVLSQTPRPTVVHPGRNIGSAPSKAQVPMNKTGQPAAKTPTPMEQPSRKIELTSPQAPALVDQPADEARKTAAPDREASFSLHTPSHRSPTAARDIRVNPDTSLGTISPQEFAAQPMDQATGTPMVPRQAAVGAAPILPREGQPPMELTLRAQEKMTEGQQMRPNAAGLAETPGQTRKATAFKAAASLKKPEHSVPSSPAPEKHFGRKAKFTPPKTAVSGKKSADEASAHTARHREAAFWPHVSTQLSPAAVRDIRVNSAPPLGSISAREPAAQAAAQWTGIPLIPGQAAVGAAPNLPDQGQLPVELTLSAEERVQLGQAFSPASSPKENPGPSSREIFPRSAVPVEKPGREAAKSAVSAGNLFPVFHRASQPAPGLARDIRVNRGYVSPEAGHTPLRTPPPIQHLTDRPTGEGAPDIPAGPAQAGSDLSGTILPGVSPMAQPLSLTYGPAQGNPSSPPSEPQTDGEPSPAEESDFVRSLPDWARRFLKQSRTPSAASHTMGVARDIASLPASQEPETTQWVAPNYQPPQAAITHREKKQEERPRQAQEVQISEAEIQRTADRVYRIIEDRIRRERRRLGL